LPDWPNDRNNWQTTSQSRLFKKVYCGKEYSGCPKLLGAETKLGYRKADLAIFFWVYQNKNL
jgi:hypothetical protein